MSIADRFYTNGRNKEFEYEILDKDGNKTGLRLWLMDMECDAAVRVENEYLAKTTDMNLRYAKVDGDTVVSDVPEGKRGELFHGRAIDKYIACINRWDLNGESLFEDTEPDPDCNYENKKLLLGIPGIGAQITSRIDEISGFTKPLKKG